MKGDSLMRRLRAAKPVAAEPDNHAALFARIVAEPGDPRLVEAPHERSSRLLGRNVRPRTRARPRVLAGSSLGLVGVGAALVLALSGSAAPPAFAITRSGDGSVLVNINQLQSLPAGEPQAHRDGDPRAGHHLYGVRGGSRQWPGDLHAGARCQPFGAAAEGSRGQGRHGGHRPRASQLATLARAPSTWPAASSRVTPARAIPATRAPVDPLTTVDARPARASAMARFAVRPPR